MATLLLAIKYSWKYALFLSQMLYAFEAYTVYELESKALTTISSTKMYLQNGRCLILFKSFKGNSTCKMSAMCRCHPAASRKVKGGSSMHQIGSGFCMLLLLLYLTASLHFMSNTALPACEIFWCSVLHWTALAFGDRQTDTCTYGSRVGAASFVSGRSGWQTWNMHTVFPSGNQSCVWPVGCHRMQTGIGLLLPIIFYTEACLFHNFMTYFHDSIYILITLFVSHIRERIVLFTLFAQIY